MHPILRQRRHLALYLLAWLPLAALLGAALRLAGGPSWGQALAVAAPACTVLAFICLASWYVVRANPIGRTSVDRILAALSAGAVLSASAWLGLVWLAIGLIAHTSGLTGLTVKWTGRQYPVLAVGGVFLYLLAAAFHYLLASLEESRRTERRLLELELLSRETELKLLRAQIDPHFLFNALNSIAALTHSDPDRARRMCTGLGDFFRQSLRLGGQKHVRLAEELNLARSFLAIEQIRYGHRLVVEEKIGEGCADCRVPPLLLQPLVENAVRHGIARTLEGGVVLIEASREGSMLRLAVENPWEDESPRAPHGRGPGFGLEIVRRRLLRLYGSQAEVKTSGAGARFRVELTAPAESAEPASPRGGEGS